MIGPVASQISRFGTASSDGLIIAQAFDGSIYSGVVGQLWSKIPTPGAFPWSLSQCELFTLEDQPEMYVAFWLDFAPSGSNIVITPNLLALTANNSGFQFVSTQTFATITTTPTLAKDWIWTAWQVVNAPDPVTFRFWYQLGVAGTVQGPSVRTVPYSAFQAVQPGWTPFGFSEFAFNGDDAPATSRASLFHVSFLNTNSAPSNATLQANSNTTQPNLSAIGDYVFDWLGTAPRATDQSSRGCTLQLSGFPVTGTAVKGALAPM